jgi:hypothetical protein
MAMARLEQSDCRNCARAENATSGEMDRIQQQLEAMVRKRAGAQAKARLASPIHIGMGVK